MTRSSAPVYVMAASPACASLVYSCAKTLATQADAALVAPYGDNGLPQCTAESLVADWNNARAAVVEAVHQAMSSKKDAEVTNPVTNSVAIPAAIPVVVAGAPESVGLADLFSCDAQMALTTGSRILLLVEDGEGQSLHTQSALNALMAQKVNMDTVVVASVQCVKEEPQVVLDQLRGRARPTAITPLMFQQQLLERARADVKHIILPEGEDDRVLRAADIILRKKCADLTILGDPQDIAARADKLGLDLSQASVVDPTTYDDLEDFASTYYEMRKHKGITLDDARQRMQDISYFATMMIYKGKADGMVSGAAHTTAHTIRPSFEIIKTKPGVSTVSSIFLMCLDTEVLAFGDCAVNISPTPQQLADIAASSAETAAAFGVDPRVALISYSTGTSGKGPAVEAVKEAVELLKERDLGVPVDGPLQFDAAVDADVAAAKAPDSDVAGRATVLVFPDLNTGNTTYKAVQRTSGALAVGPILQGLNKPINDLSRGALVEDIVNTVVVTAIQAQATPAD